mmetsp:Transcript_40258/g.66081  ORF Transcript_40258/g.66081 Transcript_40258/m.66081 type:complete len:231 (+) Transcript_40258:105-797(+)
MQQLRIGRRRQVFDNYITIGPLHTVFLLFPHQATRRAVKLGIVETGNGGTRRLQGRKIHKREIEGTIHLFVAIEQLNPLHLSHAAKHGQQVRTRHHRMQVADKDAGILAHVCRRRTRYRAATCGMRRSRRTVKVDQVLVGRNAIVSGASLNLSHGHGRIDRQRGRKLSGTRIFFFLFQTRHQLLHAVLLQRSAVKSHHSCGFFDTKHLFVRFIHLNLVGSRLRSTLLFDL